MAQLVDLRNHNGSLESTLDLCGLSDIVIMCAALAATGSKSEGGRLIEALDHRAIVRKRDGRVFAFTKKGYTPVQFVDAFASGQELVDEGQMEWVAGGNFDDGARGYLIGKVGEAEVIPGDRVGQYLVFGATHDCSGSVIVGWSEKRLACENAVRAALASAKKSGLSIKHTASATRRVADIRKALDIAKKEFDASAEFQRALASASMNFSMWERFRNQMIPLPEGTRVNKKGEEVPVSTTRAQKKRELMDDILNNLRGNVHISKGVNVADTLYGARNALTEMLNHYVTVRGSSDVVDARARRWESVTMGANADMVQRADEVLLEMLQA